MIGDEMTWADDIFDQSAQLKRPKQFFQLILIYKNVRNSEIYIWVSYFTFTLLQLLTAIPSIETNSVD